MFRSLFSARGLKTVITLVFLALSALSALAFYISQKYNLPIPVFLSLVSTALPFADWFTTFGTISAFSSPQSPHTRKSRSKKPFSTLFFALNLLLLALQSVSLTSNSTSLSPQVQQCTLESQWQQWVSAKQGDTIKELQNSLSCCGFNTVTDRQYPFTKVPKKGDGDKGRVPPETCALAYGGVDKAKACGPLWKQEMNIVAILYLAVSSFLAFWKFVLLVLAWGRPDILSARFKQKGSDYDYNYDNRITEEADGDDEEDGIITNGTGTITNGVNQPSNIDSESSRLIVPRSYGATNATHSREHGEYEAVNRNRLEERGAHDEFDDSENSAWAREVHG